MAQHGFFGNSTAGLDVNAVDSAGFTPLMHAVEMGDDSLVTSLLANPAIDINHQSDSGESALTLAIDSDNVSITKRLLITLRDPHVSLSSDYLLSDTLVEALTSSDIPALYENKNTAFIRSLIYVGAGASEDQVILSQKVLSFSVAEGSDTNTGFIAELFGLPTGENLAQYDDVRFVIADVLRNARWDLYNPLIDYYEHLYQIPDYEKDAYFFCSADVLDAYDDDYDQDYDAMVATHPFLIALECGYTQLLEDFLAMDESCYLITSLYECRECILDLLPKFDKHVLQVVLSDRTFCASIGLDSHSLYVAAVESSSCDMCSVLLANVDAKVPSDLLKMALEVNDDAMDCVKCILASDRVVVPLTDALSQAVKEHLPETAAEDTDGNAMLLALIDHPDLTLSKEDLLDLIKGPELPYDSTVGNTLGF